MISDDADNAFLHLIHLPLGKTNKLYLIII
jgi:hypothetical protein